MNYIFVLTRKEKCTSIKPKSICCLLFPLWHKLRTVTIFKVCWTPCQWKIYSLLQTVTYPFHSFWNYAVVCKCLLCKTDFHKLSSDLLLPFDIFQTGLRVFWKLSWSEFTFNDLSSARIRVQIYEINAAKLKTVYCIEYQFTVVVIFTMCHILNLQIAENLLLLSSSKRKLSNCICFFNHVYFI